jgi:CRISPR-associated protein Csd1
VIIQSLVRRYEDTADVKPGWQKRGVAYALELSENGTLLGIRSLGAPSEKKTAKMTLVLPEAAGRSGKKAYETAYFLCDDSGFMLGIDPKKFESARKLHTGLLGDIDVPAAKAITAYFTAGAPAHTVNPNADKPDIADSYTFHLAGGNVIIADKDMTGAKFVFMVNGKRVDYADGDSKIIDAWESSLRQNGEQRLCLVTGELDSIIRLHYKVGLNGVTMGSQPLISMNDQTSFRSYGSTPKDPAAQIGEKAAFAYATALNGLLADSNHHKSLGGDTLVYWAEGSDEKEAETFSLMANPAGGDDDKTLTAIMEQISQGKRTYIEGIKWEKQFYILCLSPNAARISVRFFYVNNFGNIIEKISEHYANLEIYSSRDEKYKYIPYWILLSETTIKKSASDAAPLLGGQLLNSILTGTAYPMTLYNATLTRIRAGEEINRTKAAIIKAAMIRNFNDNKESEETTVALNPNSDDRAYTLGRLFATLEREQSNAAGGSLNATIRDKYFTSACANPKIAFVTLLKLSMNHAKKLGKNSIWLEKLKSELLAKLDDLNPYPASQSLEEQGKFILGYYHQTQEFFTSKKDKEIDENV